MKKLVVGVLTTAMLLVGSGNVAYACGHHRGTHSFVDANCDGYCDHAGISCAYVDANGNGYCDVCGGTHAQCAGRHYYYVDANADGYCDVCAGSKTQCGGRHYCYVDVNGDGICDHFQGTVQTARSYRQSSWSGHGCGSHHGRCH